MLQPVHEYELLDPIHRAAYEGDEAEVVRLVREDPGRRLNAQVQGWTFLDGLSVEGCTPMMMAAFKGHDAVVGRLVALGAGVGLTDADDETAAHWACRGLHSPALALLLDAGAPINARDRWGRTPLMWAAVFDAARCAALLLARSGSALELDAKDHHGWTALHWAALNTPDAIVGLLLQAGADPTIRNHCDGDTPLDIVRRWNHAQSIALLQAGLAEPLRPRFLLKARALCDASSHPDSPIPVYLQGRVTQQGQHQPLPQVQINNNNDDDNDEELVGACVRFALGLEGHGGWAGAEDERATMRTEGLFPELFIELCELLVPRWDPARKGRPLGEGMEELGGL